MSVCCIDCGRYSVKRAGKMARHGLGVCLLELSTRTGVPVSYTSPVHPRRCENFVAIKDDERPPRERWLTQHNMKAPTP